MMRQAQWVKGSDRGPDAILEASVNLEFYDIETGTEVHKKGIYTIAPLLEKKSPEALISAVYDKALHLLTESRFPVFYRRQPYSKHWCSPGILRIFPGPVGTPARRPYGSETGI